jgi:hypothetical protein
MGREHDVSIEYDLAPGTYGSVRVVRGRNRFSIKRNGFSHVVIGLRSGIAVLNSHGVRDSSTKRLLNLWWEKNSQPYRLKLDKIHGWVLTKEGDPKFKRPWFDRSRFKLNSDRLYQMRETSIRFYGATNFPGHIRRAPEVPTYV